MTIICAATADDGTWIGSDTICTDGAVKLVFGPKWRNFGAWWIASAGDQRIDDVMHGIEDAIGAATDIRELAALIRTATVEDGFTTVSDNRGGAPNYESQFAAVHGRRVYEIDGSFATQEMDGFAAVGSGRQFALGAYAAMSGAGSGAIVLKAIEAASRFSVNCGGEPWVHFVPAD